MEDGRKYSFEGNQSEIYRKIKDIAAEISAKPTGKRPGKG
jgi:hypothetical protein